MAIGRMISHMIAHGVIPSSAYIGQGAQKKLYQIRRLLQQVPDLTNQQLGDILGENEKNINDLIRATEYNSLDNSVGDSDTRFGDLIASDDKYDQ